MKSLYGAAAVAGLQAFLWVRIQFWVGAAGAALLAVALTVLALRSPRPNPVRNAAAWLLAALMAMLCFLPIREGAVAERSVERWMLTGLAVAAILALYMACRTALGAATRNRAMRKPLLLSVVAVLAAFLVADLMQWVRPSMVSTLACTGSLLRGRPDTASLLQRHQGAINSEAARHDLPPALVAAVIVDHQHQQTFSSEFSDCAGSAMGVNLSLGLSQMRLGTAAFVDGRSLADMPPPEYRSLRAALLEPSSNIAYEARELRALLERSIRFPGMDAATLLHSPAVMALLVSEYRKGRMSTPSTDSPLNINAFSTLELMQDGSLQQFDNPEHDPVRARALIREYLGQIYCRSDLFNPGTCQRWEQRQLAVEPEPALP